MVGPTTSSLRWKRDLGGNLTPGPVIGGDGSVLAADNSGVLYALDPAGASVRWHFNGGSSYGSDLSTSPAVTSGGTILWPGPANTLYALTAAGEQLWTQPFTDPVLSPAVADGGRVYVADMGGHLTALDVDGSHHRTLWSLQVGGGVDYASPTVGPDGTIYTAFGSTVAAVRDLGTTAAVSWKRTVRALIEVSNGVSPDGIIVVGTNGDREYGLDANGHTSWSLNIGDYTYSSSTVAADRTAYFGDNMGRLHVIDSRTGAVRQTIAPLGAGNEKIWTSAASDAAGDFYWGTTAGNIYGYRRDGTQLFHLAVGSPIDGYPAIAADGTLYVGSTAGTLYAIGGTRPRRPASAGTPRESRGVPTTSDRTWPAG